ncbi:transmembrane protein 178B-like [Mya arenaria]|nr:transmembrane protein 178B-like [Mya arenaria]XP_052819710.1 transmembrane protein 178B-like [Mya arenaria]
MARMGRCHLCLLFTVLFMILISLALLVTCITTDYWYLVETDSSDSTIQRNYSYSIGMWRRCYDNVIPLGVPAEDRAGDCVYTYKDMTRRAEDNMSSENYKYLSLERSWVALMIAAAGMQLFTVVALIFGLWPGDCKAVKRSTLYLIAALMTLLATMAAIASGICFIAMRDLDKTSRAEYPSSVSTSYGWSFIVAWVGTGLGLLEAFIFLALLRIDYEDVAETGRYNNI